MVSTPSLNPASPAYGTHYRQQVRFGIEKNDPKASDQSQEAKPPKNGRIYQAKQSAKLATALALSMGVPIGLTLVSGFIPFLLISIPVSYISGKVGRKMISNLENADLSGTTASITRLMNLINKPADIPKDLSEEKLKNHLDSEKEKRAQQIDDALDTLLTDIAGIRFLGRLREPIKGIIKSDLLKKLSKKRMISNVEQKGRSRLLALALNTTAADSKSPGEFLKKSVGILARASVFYGVELGFRLLGGIPVIGKPFKLAAPHVMLALAGFDVLRAFSDDDEKPKSK